MELDELKQRWSEYDRSLEAAIRLNTRMLRQSVLEKASTALKRLARWVVVELALASVAVIWLGSFLWDHAGEPRFLAPAALLHLSAILLIASGARQLVAISRLDYGAPIVTIQKRLESLRIARIRASKWALLLGPLLWVPCLIVAVKGFLGVDVYALLGGAWIASNLLLGLAVIGGALWISRRYAGQMEAFPLVQRLMRDLAGHNLNAATGFLHSIADFENERNGAA